MQATPIVYQAGTSIAEIEKRFGLKGVVKLASNENPLGPSPLALAALKSPENFHRYPDDKNSGLSQMLAERLQVAPERILLSDGTTPLIDMIIRSCCAHDEEVLFFEKTFIYYKISAQNNQRKFQEVARAKDFQYDFEALLQKITLKTKVIFLAAPDNPTGVYLSQGDLERLLARMPKSALLVLDEAYREYVPASRCIDPLQIEDPRLLIVRTFSKVYGLAGLRCGYAVGAPSLISKLSALQAPFSVSSLAHHAASAALCDERHLRRTYQLNSSEREKLEAFLTEKKVYFIPSSANFVLIKTAPLSGDAVYQRLLAEGVIVRGLDIYGLYDFIRVSLGLPEENQKFIKAFSNIISNTKGQP